MNWAEPVWLWLLVPIGLFALVEATRGLRRAWDGLPRVARLWAGPRGVRPGNGSNRGRSRWRLWIGLALVSAALARPQWGVIEQPVFHTSREVLIAFDLSRSMLADDVRPTRLDRAKLLTQGLLDDLRGERVGLLLFAGTAFLQVPLSADYEVLRDFLPQLGPDYLPAGGTDFNAMLEAAEDAFSRESDVDRFLILLSDGESQTDNWKRPAARLRERNVQAICLGVGTTEGSVVPDRSGGLVRDGRGAVVLTRLDPHTLQELADVTGGVYVDASEWVDLGQILRQTVEAGRAGVIGETRNIIRVERFQWLLGPALFFLLWSYLREFPARPRPRTYAPGGKGIAITALMFAAGLRIPSTDAAEPTPEPAGKAELVRTIDEMSGRSALRAGDCAQIAVATLNYGEPLKASGQPVPPSIVHDALAAVDAGEQSDARTANWPELRRRLEELLEEDPPPPEDDEDDDDDENDDDSDDSDDDSNGGNGGNGEDGENDSEGGEGDPEHGDGDDSPDGGDDSGAPSDGPDGADPDHQPRSGPDAFGDFSDPADQPGSPDEVEEPEPMQTVGGTRADTSSELDDDPALAMPLQRLEEAKNQDDPGRLFYLMQDPPPGTEPDVRDW